MKKILVVLMAMLTMAVMLTGCGGDSKKAAYPADGDISVIIPKAPGGGTDISARGLIQFMEKELKGSKFVPVNKPDGGGVTGMVELANAKPDGHTLGMVTVELAMFPHQGKCKNTYKDYAAICAPIAAPAALIVPKDAPYNNVDEFVAFAKANPGKVKEFVEVDVPRPRNEESLFLPQFVETRKYVEDLIHPTVENKVPVETFNIVNMVGKKNSTK